MNELRRTHQRGQDLAEYALILPVFMLLVLVIIDLGRVVYYYSAVHNAAREGARYGIIHPDDTAGIEARVRYIAAGLQPDLLAVSSILVDQDPDSRNRVDHVRVTVTYQFQPASIIIARMFGLTDPSDAITLGSRSMMRLE